MLPDLQPDMRIILTLATILTCIFNSKAQNADGIYSYTEQMPEFMGEYNVYKLTHLKYPAEARKDSIEGRCVIKFIVDTNGTVENAIINKSAHPILDSEAIRFISTMHKWKPAEHNGTPVKCYQVLVIPFTLKDIGKTLESDEIFESMPEPPKDWQLFLADNLRRTYSTYYPRNVYAQFTVDEYGSVDSITILPKEFPSWSAEEIIYSLKKMKKWKPGLQNGVYVKVKFTLPITFHP